MAPLWVKFACGHLTQSSAYIGHGAYTWMINFDDTGAV